MSVLGCFHGRVLIFLHIPEIGTVFLKWRVWINCWNHMVITFLECWQHGEGVILSPASHFQRPTHDSAIGLHIMGTAIFAIFLHPVPSYDANRTTLWKLFLCLTLCCTNGKSMKYIFFMCYYEGVVTDWPRQNDWEPLSTKIIIKNHLFYYINVWIQITLY